MVKNGLVPYPSAFNTLLSPLIWSGSFDEAWRLFSDFRAKVGIVDERSLGIMVKGCCEAGRLDRGFKIFAQLKEMNWSPMAYVYTALIDGCCKHGDVERAGELFSEMSELGLVANRNTYRLYRKMKLSRVVPSVRTCNLTIDVLCKEGDVNGPFELFDEMRERGIAYSIVTFSTVIRGLCCDSRVWEAKRLVDLIKRSGINPDSIGHSPSLVTHDTLIAGSARAKNMPAVTDLMKEMEETQERGIAPSKVTYTILIDAFVRSDDIEKASDIYASMQKAGFIPDAHTYGVLVHGLCMNGNMNEASKFAQGSSYRALIFLTEMGKKGMVPPCLVQHSLRDFEFPKLVEKNIRYLVQYFEISLAKC
ncbi:hypothetical protein ACJRO7_031744 [Eucalyptus globulus]|uniref:Pentatricopeptide repeat-containing protein n=1 Tax=Eucalyptus globulus TaxID=34317 RepID=A0ABD3JM24_EUCGL